MTVKEMSHLIGKVMNLQTQEFFMIPVEILDVRKVYSRIDYLCTPVNGEGEKWVSAERIFRI